MAQGKILAKPIVSTMHDMNSLTDLHCNNIKGAENGVFTFFVQVTFNVAFFNYFQAYNMT